MRFPPLLCGRFLRRYKRFFADIEIEGERVTAHCPNSGSMKNCMEEGCKAFISRSQNPKRKLPFTLELLEVSGSLVLVNTMRPNEIIAEGILAGRIPPLSGYANLRREVPYGNHSRVDLLLTDSSRPDCYVEVKNATMGVGGGLTLFPDAVTERGTKHLHELMERVRMGDRAALVFSVGREKTERVGIAREIDPHYGEAILEAREAGVEILAARLAITPESVEVAGLIPVEL